MEEDHKEINGNVSMNENVRPHFIIKVELADRSSSLYEKNKFQRKTRDFRNEILQSTQQQISGNFPLGSLAQFTYPHNS